MTTSARRAELLRRLRDQRPDLDELRALLALRDDDDRAVVHAAAIHLGLRVHEAIEPLPVLAAVVPADLEALAPETQGVLAALALAGLPLAPPPDLSALPALVRVAWLRVTLVGEPARLDEIAATAAGREALADLPVEPMVASGLLERMLVARQDGVRRIGLSALRGAIARGWVAPATAERWLLGAIDGASAATAAAAMALCGESWACGLALPPLPRGAADDAQRGLARIELLRRRRAIDGLRRELAASPDRDERVLAAAIAALGELGDAADRATIVDAMAARPDALASATIAALVALSRRGLGPDDVQARRVFALYLDAPTISARDVGEVLRGRADAVIAAVDAALHDDPDGAPDWRRVVALLEALATERACRRLIAMIATPRERPGWPAAIAALGRLERADAEAAVLDRLDDEPDAGLAGLAQLGGDATIAALRAALGGDRDPTRARPRWAGAGARLLLQLAPSDETLEALAAGGLLDDAALASLPAHGPLATAPALRAMASTAGHPLRGAAIAALGRSGDPLAIDHLGALLDDPDDEVRPLVIAALRALGARLHALGAPRPRGVAGAPDPGAAAVTSAALGRLRSGGLDDDALARLLDPLAGASHLALVPRVRPLLRHRNPELRKRAAAALAGAGPAAIAWLLPRLADDDLRVARQALLALGALGARSAAPAIAAFLAQSNMNLKKTAAEVLATAGDPVVTGALIAVLAHHDNPGYRALVRTALRAIHGDWYLCVVIAALDDAATPRAIELLVAELDGLLTGAEVAALEAARARRAPTGGWSDTLVARIDARRIALAGNAEPADLDAERRRRGMGDRVPIAAGAPDPDDARGHAITASVRARRALGRALAAPEPDAAAIAAHAGAARLAPVAPLSPFEAHALLDRWAALDDDARTPALALLVEPARADAGVRIRVGDAVRGRAREDLPAELAALLAPRWDLDEARWWLGAPSAAASARAAQIVRLERDRGPASTMPRSAAAAITADLIGAGGAEEAFRWCALDDAMVRTVVAQVAHALGTTTALDMIARWQVDAPARRGALLDALFELGATEPAALRALIQAPDVDLARRGRALERLRARGPAHHAQADRALFAALAEAGPPPLRTIATAALLAHARLPERHRLLDRYLDGALDEHLAVQLGPADVAWLARALDDSTGDRRRRAIWLLGNLDDPRREALALAVWRGRRDDARVTEACRALLRGAPFERVLALVEDDLATSAGWALDILPARALIPPALLARLDRVHRDSLIGYLGGTTGTLIAPGLGARLADAIVHDGHAGAMALLARLADWSVPADAAALVAALGRALTGPDRARVVGAMIEGVRGRDAAARADVLGAIARADDEASVLALIDVVLAAPSVIARLSPALRAAIERGLRAQVHGHDVERVRAILTARVQAVTGDADRAAVIDTLEGSLAHPASRVRLHALRLLRQVADRARYVRASRILLGDRDPSIVRSAIRIVAYGGDDDAGVALAELLDHAHNAVRAAARDGLVTLGPAALPALLHAIAHARPDRRAAIEALRDEIEDAAARAEAAS